MLAEIWWIPVVIASVFIAAVGGAWAERTRMHRKRQLWEPWRFRYEEGVRGLLDAYMLAAEHEKDLVVLLREVPVEYHRPLVEAMRLARGMPRALLKVARDRGLVGPDDLDLLGAVTEMDAEERGKGRTSSPPSAPVPIRAVDETSGPPMKWKDGRPVPRRVAGGKGEPS